jgi:hypothetical protein
LKKIHQKNRAGGGAHSEGPEFKPQHCKKEKKKAVGKKSTFWVKH